MAEEQITETAAVEVKEPPTEIDTALAKIEKVEKKPIALNSQGAVVPKDHSEAWRLAQVALSSKALPKVFENVAQVFVARQFLIGLDLNPDVAIQKTTIINGTISIHSDLPLGLCKKSGLFVEQSFKEMLLDKDYNEISLTNKNLHVAPWVGVCTVQRKDAPLITRTFTIDQAKTAGLLDKTNSVWKPYPHRMLQMRTRSFALKDAFADVLSGVSILEYDHNELPDVPAMGGGQIRNVAEDLNDRYLQAPENSGQETAGLN